jgi:hypothetical protein
MPFFVQFGERFVRQSLYRRHPVAPKLVRLIERVVVKRNSRDPTPRVTCWFNGEERKLFRNGTIGTDVWPWRFRLGAIGARPAQCLLRSNKFEDRLRRKIPAVSVYPVPEAIFLISLAGTPPALPQGWSTCSQPQL